MKKIINGKIYDTDTAIKIAAYGNNGGWKDFSHYEETLYRKKTGEFFLHGVGGPMTKYAVSTGQNCWTGGEKIFSLTENEAKKWLEEYADPEIYLSCFPACE